MTEADPLFENAIVYSRHDAGYVLGYAYHKLQLLDFVQRLPDLGTPPEWQAWVDGIDQETVLTCPIPRAWRVHGALCAARPVQPGCQPMPGEYDPLELIEANARRDGLCGSVLNAPVERLFYSPVVVDLIRDTD